MRTSWECRLKRLKPALSMAASRSAVVVMRRGSTEWMRNGSMMVLKV